MKGKYINTIILQACLSKRRVIKKDIYTQLSETIAERKKLIKEWENSFIEKPLTTKNDIHTQLEQTIAELKKVMQQSADILSPGQDSYSMPGKQAA